jgi:hypothetical protein
LQPPFKEIKYTAICPVQLFRAKRIEMDFIIKCDDISQPDYFLVLKKNDFKNVGAKIAPPILQTNSD